ncbi:hypothetical protein L9Z41_02255 [Leptospira noguchii]|uniref:hypothetical protein n=1 Tax=Leptospira noguchii TaxID=28182 RepID=UPI001F06D167|nr:hypothetical protein [Leptospira noguchii]MCH1914505.1 hypothetical protein [Leptospira noguchii]
MFEIFSFMLEFGLEESILALNEKACTGGAQFLKITNKTLNLRSESDRSENPAMQHEFYHSEIGIYEEFKMLRCRLERRARFARANSPNLQSREVIREMECT